MVRFIGKGGDVNPFRWRVEDWVFLSGIVAEEFVYYWKKFFFFRLALRLLVALPLAFVFRGTFPPGTPARFWLAWSAGFIGVLISPAVLSLVRIAVGIVFLFAYLAVWACISFLPWLMAWAVVKCCRGNTDKIHNFFCKPVYWLDHHFVYLAGN